MCWDESHPCFMGMLGSYGNRCANMAVARADLLLVLGSRLDSRQTGAQLDSFLPGGKIIHVDIDAMELEHNRLKNRLKINTDAASFLRQIDTTLLQGKDLGDWLAYLGKLKTNYGQDKEISRFVKNSAPYEFMRALNRFTGNGDAITVDIGQNQMWAAQTIILRENQRFVTSGGLAPMGFALPAAVGISFANPGRRVYCLCGDGGFHIALQSLMLISQYNLPVTVVVFNNKALGMITQFQHLYFDNRMNGTTQDGGYMVPDIGAIGKAYGLEAFSISAADLTDEALLGGIFAKRNCILECKIDGLTTVSPKLEYNQPIGRPSPLLPEEEQARILFP